MRHLLRRLNPNIVISLLLAGAVSIILAVSLIGPLISRPAPLRISAGSTEGKRHEIAKTIVEIARRKGLSIADPVATEGSVETIKLVAEGKLDVGLVQGGLRKYLEDPELRSASAGDSTEKTDLSRIRQLHALDLEPLHLLFKPGLVKEGITRIEDLRARKKTLNLSEKGSGTHLLALQLLQLLELTPETDYIEKNCSYQNLKTLTDEALPDAVFTVSLLKSPIAQYLIDRHGYRIVDIPYGGSLSIDNPTVKATVIDRHVYGPDQTMAVETAGTSLLLITNSGVPDEDIKKLLESTTGAEFNTINRMPLREQIMEYPPHPAVETFIRKNDQIFTRGLLMSGYVINGLLSLLLIFSILSLRSVWSKRKLELEHLQQTETYSNYRQAVSGLEQELERLMNENPDDYLAGLNRLRKKLVEIRGQASQAFFQTESIDYAASAHFQRYINSVISSVERLERQ